MAHLLKRYMYQLGAALLMLLLAPSAYSATYSLPADIGINPFNSCSGGGPNYTCTGNVNLANDSTINLTDNVTLNISGKFDSGRRLNVTTNGFIFNIIATGEVTIERDSNFTGNITTSNDRDIVIEDGVTIVGNLSADDDIDLADNITITGDLTAGDDVKIDNSVTITGDIIAADDVEVIDNLTFVGNITAADNITIDDDAVITGNIISTAGDITIDDRATITGNIITTAGSVDIDDNLIFVGNITASADVIIDKDGVVTGNLTAGGTLDIDATSTVSGICSPYHVQCSSFPIVISIARDQANPTTLTTLSWTVTFNSAVTGVDTTDFSLVMAGGVTGAIITSVNGSGTTWTVTVNSGIGDGTLGLNLDDNDSIFDGSSLPLGGVGLGNGDFTGEVYTLNKPATVLNTYYPGTTSASAGATSIVVGAANGSSTPISSGDLLLIIQMQDATINNTNTSSYGDGVSGDPASGVSVAGGAGSYEYIVASNNVPLTGGTLTITCGLTNGYTNANATGTSGQKTFQVVRVPIFASYTLPPVAAEAWNGSTGGVLAFDVTGNLSLNSATIDVDGIGFRGGGIQTYTSGSGSNTDYRTPALSNNANGSKGEGIAGTPYQVFTSPDQLTLNPDGEGYPFGSRARGAPGNAGGGATDRNPPNNDQNSGGGGGANGGDGGIGGIGWCPGFDAGDATYYGCGIASLVSAVNPNGSSGGFGGKTVSSLGATKLTLGGGGGAATANNITGSGDCATINGLCSSGAAGGGIIMIRAGTMSGTASFSARGGDGDSSIGNDGSGGAGAGGVVLISAGSGMAGVSIDVQGGTGGSNLVPATGYSSRPHGPGGGGGGGISITSGTIASCTASGGANGVTYNNGVYFGAYGATSGSSGSCDTSLTSSQIPGAGLGGSAICFDHYAISHSGDGVTCEASAITISAHSSTHSAESPSNVTTITLSTTSANPGTEAWSLKSGGGTFTPPNQYTFSGVESLVELWYSQTTTETGIDIDVTDGTITEVDDGNNANGKDAEDPSINFANTAFRFVDTSTSNAITIGTQIAGKPSSTAAPSSQTVGLQAIRTDISTGECQALFENQITSVDLGYECNNPISCTGSDLLSLSPESTYNSGSAVTLPRNNNGLVAADTAVNLVFDVNGIAPLSFIYNDAGQITLYASKDIASPAITITGSSNPFVTRPFGFDLDFDTGSGAQRAADWLDNSALDGSDGDPSYATDATGSVFTTAGSNFDITIRAVLWEAADDGDSNGIPDARRNLTDNGATPNFSGVALDFSFFDQITSTTSVGGPASPTFNAGITTQAMNWPEVGVIDIGVTHNDYLGDVSADITTTAYDVGRFTPDHFTVSTNNNGSYSNSCTTGTPFTYIGDSFGYTVNPTVKITAENALNQPTQNYTTASGFAQLSAAEVTVANYPTTDGTALDQTSATLLGLNSSVASPSKSLADFVTGEAILTLGSGDQLNYDHATGMVIPFTADIPFEISSISEATDNITGSGLPFSGTPSGNSSRFGKGYALDGYSTSSLIGSTLTLSIGTQYFDASGSWINNSDDSCSQFSYIKTDNGITTTAAPASPTTLSGGEGNLTLTLTADAAPVGGNATIDTTFDTWLRSNIDSIDLPTDGNLYDDNPSGIATFGSFRGDDRILFWQEAEQ